MGGGGGGGVRSNHYLLGKRGRVMYVCRIW